MICSLRECYCTFHLYLTWDSSHGVAPDPFSSWTHLVLPIITFTIPDIFFANPTHAQDLVDQRSVTCVSSSSGRTAYQVNICYPLCNRV
uniref:Uncharacterized protein n=1 Tax=Salmo trutta TaxID=8032 RepID=A0A673XRG3_SALTR